ncbi:hypothetical protein ABFS82_14G311400 [Erythranthe guttata]|uniref:Filament-like plant protein n=1 Tax=Erythranthe guttata TaxID=4155 RepID=A0A022QBK1_ERYGU|nr:PREDICTED: filament-like plant protein [Erythranthe guttata]EYU23885.1 hypothetical protein MIMGU_mgv1a003261mg [Erythranthe guttata]|eukprot:XP_012853448.1 PREDICTED: filament-like plant protein [Erythranthe guttata]
MDKRKWLWKRRSSERSPGESESSGSFSSHSERYSDEQEALRESPNDSQQSPEVTSKSTITEQVKESVKSLTEKLSAALVNVSAKEDLVKQHAKVAEEAVAGWEKAENEVAALKQQLEVAVQQNLNLEVRASHLDGALKECVRELRQAKDEQEKRISDALSEKNTEWESTKSELEKQILDLKLQVEASRSQNSASIVEGLKKENSSLKKDLVSCYEELEIMTIERDLSTRAAETASKVQLESIKKIAKLESECRKLQTISRKSSPSNNQKPSFYPESLTDSHSDKDINGSERSFSELDQFKTVVIKPSVEIDMMDDFLEMERLVALPETKSSSPVSGESISVDDRLRTELDSMTQRVAELEDRLEKIESEKLELENILERTVDSLKDAQARSEETETKLEELQQEMNAVNETKELLEFQLVDMEVEARTMSANVDSLKAEIEEERKLSAEMKVRCRELENELARTIQEIEIEHNNNSNSELKIKQEDLAVAADKLAECQKTIASLGRQLQSLATLEDFLIDSSNIPGLSTKNMLTPKSDLDRPRMSADNYSLLTNGNEDLSLSPLSTNHITTGKNRSSFGKFFSRSKSVREIENSRD